MTTLALPALDGTQPIGFYAALGAARLLSARFPDLTLRWDEAVPVLTGGPTSVEEAAEAIWAESIARIADGGVLPDVDPAYPPPGRDWWGHTIDAKGHRVVPQLVDKMGRHGPYRQAERWSGEEAERWQGALMSSTTGGLHPLVWPHAAQTVRSMLAKPAEVLRANPGLLLASLAGLGVTAGYPGGLWILRNERDAGDGGSQASPGRDWLVLMSLPWMPAQGHHIAGADSPTWARTLALASTWKWRYSPSLERVAEWWLWQGIDLPAASISAWIDSSYQALPPHIRCGAYRISSMERVPYGPPYLIAATRKQITEGRLGEPMTPALDTFEDLAADLGMAHLNE